METSSRQSPHHRSFAKHCKEPGVCQEEPHSEISYPYSGFITFIEPRGILFLTCDYLQDQINTLVINATARGLSCVHYYSMPCHGHSAYLIHLQILATP